MAQGSTVIRRTRTTRRTWGSVVRQADPDYDAERHRHVMYDFSPQGGDKFVVDPFKLLRDRDFTETPPDDAEPA